MKKICICITLLLLKKGQQQTTSATHADDRMTDDGLKESRLTTSGANKEEVGNFNNETGFATEVTETIVTFQSSRIQEGL